MSASFPSHTRRQRLLRRLVPLVAAAVAVAWLAVTLVGTNSSQSIATTTTMAVLTPSTTTTSTVPVTTTTMGEGALPQTGTYPSSASPQFLAAMGDLFNSVAHGTPQSATQAFFPEAAYVQLKSIPGAASDWQNRLLAEYYQDLGAATAELGAGAASATLVSVQVPSQFAHWVPVGVCENSVGYFEVANSRVVYSIGGVIRSFGIASMISWRGEWYVVHLGTILRSGGGGVVLDPQTGPGTSARSGTC